MLADRRPRDCVTPAAELIPRARWVLIESGGSIAPTIVCLPRPVDIDRRSLPTTADPSKLARAVDAATGLSGSMNWTAATIHVPMIRVMARS